ncbi:hypothetical protein SAMN05421821_10170 [Mucilaginibacter lappiensis]|uniref:Uncharacterized protein n=1 Tax=Mucilaginibacter lappiensis TaxID=354630 RepID=A0A1N6NBM2_9SPHI|nr:hypothetical protein [Mucilaginibacter lappiensis]MBB6125911.1 hypothetical protein [Mucilaginibacter lappiensis]SIP89489.1 hypothetical protein SAMN05421821_10170 [Mucilaginibacter lappiensis]
MTVLSTISKHQDIVQLAYLKLIIIPLWISKVLFADNELIHKTGV